MTDIHSCMPNLNIALIGHGLWGRNILRDLIHLGHSVFVVEPDPTAAQAARENGAQNVYSTLDELAPTDGTIVATPAVTHALIVSTLIKRGHRVLCEKPLTANLAEARELAAIADGRLFVGHIWIHHPGIEALAAIARSGELGPIHGVRSFRTNWTSPRTDVDSSWNLAPHDVAIAQFLLGSIPTPRFALAERLNGACVGLLGILGDTNGETPWAVFEVSNRYQEKRREVRLHCRDGVAILQDADSDHIAITRSLSDGTASTELRKVSQESALRRELSAFCNYINGGPPPPTDAKGGLAVVECIVNLRQLAELDPT
jgi:predicted dehydrogenase